MPFQGNPNAGQMDPQLMSLLFQARKDRAALAIEQQRMQIEGQRQAKEDGRKDEIHRLDSLLKRADLAGKMKEMGGVVDSARRNATETTSQNLTEEDLMGDGGGADFANLIMQYDPTAAGQVQESAAAQANFAQSLGQFGELQRELNPGIDPISSALGAGQTVETDRAREASLKSGVDDEAMMRSDQLNQASHSRSVSAEIARENRAQRRLDAAEADFAENGEWSETAIDKLGASQEERLKFAPETTSDWRWVEKFDTKNQNSIFEAMQKWQRRNDPGGTVREGDVAMMMLLGVSTYEAAGARIKSIMGKKERLPEGLGDALKTSIKAQLENEDLKIVDAAEAFDQYAIDNRLTPSQKARSDVQAFQKRKARERVAGRMAAPEVAEADSSGGATPVEYRDAVKALSAKTGKSEADLTDGEVWTFIRAHRTSSRHKTRGGRN